VRPKLAEGYAKLSPTVKVKTPVQDVLHSRTNALHWNASQRISLHNQAAEPQSQDAQAEPGHQIKLASFEAILFSPQNSEGRGANPTRD